MAENKGLGLIETRGLFQLKGIVTGCNSSNFYKETLTRTNKPFRSVFFGVQIDKDSTIYINLNGMEQEKVFFSKSETDPVTKKKSNIIEKVDWKDRFVFGKEGFKLIGINLGIKKIMDDKGNEINDKKVLTPYDACGEISSNLEDGVSVFVKGSIEYSTYNDKRQVKFVPNQISLCKPINFEEENYLPEASFNQTIVFDNISQSLEKSKFILLGKIIGYNSIEEAEFSIMNEPLAAKFKKVLKPYQSIKVWGDIKVEKNTEEIISSDGWGNENPLIKQNSQVKRELIITGADPDSIEKEEYSQDKIDNALSKLKASAVANQEFKGTNKNTDEWGLSGESFNEDTPWD